MQIFLSLIYQLFIQDFMKIINLILYIFFFLSAVIGCSKVPDGFPQTIPCIVTITDHGKLVEGVFVQIDTIPSRNSLSVTAVTNAQGQAVIQTQLGTFAKPGVPVGKLVMILTKVPEVPDFKSTEELEKMTSEQVIAYRAEMNTRRAKVPLIIPPMLTDVQTSPLIQDVVVGKSIEWNVALEEFKKKKED
jgi:hypothetical protein